MSTNIRFISAGAGSGKTFRLTQELEKALTDGRVTPAGVVGTTFTNKAAREMQQRVGRQLGSDKARGLNISTFHTLGLNILRRELRRLDYKPGFSIFDEQDSATLIKDLLRKQPNNDETVAAGAQWRISAWKNDLIDPPEALAQAEDALDTRQALLYAVYQRALKAYNAVDFDDLILRTRALLNEPRVAAWVLYRLDGGIDHILVDEAQVHHRCPPERHLRLFQPCRVYRNQYRHRIILSPWRGLFPACGHQSRICCP